MKMRKLVTIWAMAGMTGLVLAACSGDSNDANETSDNGNSGDDAKSPIEEYLGYSPLKEQLGGGMFMAVSIEGDEEEGQEELTEKDRQEFQRVEELTAECMRDEGFEYVPVPVEESDPSTVDDPYSLEPDEFARQYGYGISTFESDDLMPTDEDDPNLAIQESLSESARKAYEKALWGAEPMMVESQDAESVGESSGEQDPEDMGCSNRAYTEVYGEDSLDFDDSEWAEIQKLGEQFFPELEALGKRLRNDSRVKAAAEEWAHCMADAGHTKFKRPADAMNSISEKYDALMMDAEKSADESTDGGGEDEVAAFGADLDPEKLAELQKKEIDVATADYECQQEHYEGTFNEVVTELEKEFVESHREDLEAYRDAMATLGEAE